MRTDGNLKIVVTISASINAHPTESSRKGHSLKSILWYLKLIQKLSRRKTKQYHQQQTLYFFKVLSDFNVLFSCRHEMIFRAYLASFQKVKKLIKLVLHILYAIMFICKFCNPSHYSLNITTG